MPAKQKTCKTCGNKIVTLPGGKGYGHKKKEHWVGKPHKAVPAPEEKMPAPA